MTWISTEPVQRVEAANVPFEERSELIEGCFGEPKDNREEALWLWLVDLKLDTLPAGGSELTWDWDGACENRWSLRCAAFAAWVSTGRPTLPESHLARAAYTTGIVR